MKLNDSAWVLVICSNLSHARRVMHAARKGCTRSALARDGIVLYDWRRQFAKSDRHDQAGAAGSSDHRLAGLAEGGDAGAPARGREHRQRQLRQGRRRRRGRALHPLLPRSRACSTTLEPHERFGDAIHIRLDDKPSNERPIVLMGHRDTVFPKGEVARRPFRIEGGRAYGPGVVDMKGGLVLNAFVLAAFKRFGGAPAPLAGLITSDEEIASPSSRPDDRARRAPGALRAQLRARPAQRQHRHRDARAACSSPSRCTGKAAHSGGNFEKGISAIGEMAHKIVAMHKLTDLKRGITRQRRPRARAASPSTPRRRTRKGRSICATSSRSSAPRRSPPCRRSSTAPRSPARPPSSRSKASSCPSRATPEAEELFGTATRRLPPMPACRIARRVLRRVRRLRVHVGGRLPDAVRRRAGRRQRAHARGIPRGRHPGAARPGHGARHPAPACGSAA